MRIEKLGDNLYKVRISWLSWAPTKELSKVILKLQEEGKVITANTCTSRLPETYLVCTTNK